MFSNTFVNLLFLNKQVARETMQAVARDRFDVPVGMVKALKIGGRVTPKGFFAVINKPEK